MIVKHCEQLWTVCHDFKVVGIPMSTRMTLAKINGNEWAAISPVPLNESSVKEINEQGHVRYLIAPNNFHHLFIQDAQQYWPDAQLFIPASLTKKRPDLTTASILTKSANYAWCDELKPLHIGGSNAIEEFFFFHPASETLVITDVCFNLVQTKGLRQTLFATITGTKGKLTSSRMIKLLFKDKSALKNSVEEALDWPFKRLIVAHGDVIEHDGAVRLRESFNWLR